MMLTPSERFRKFQPSEVKELALAVSQQWFLKSVDAALAEMAHRNQVEHISGANAFLEILTKLPEDAPAPKEPPAPHLASYDKEMDERRNKEAETSQ